MKKGQITIFLMIGVVLIVIFALLFIVLKDRITVQDEVETFDHSSIKLFVDECLKSSTEQALVDLSYSGWDYMTFRYGKELPRSFYSQGINMMPDSEDTINQIESMVLSNFLTCLSFDRFEEMGFQIDTGTMVVSSEIAGNNLITRLDYPIDVTYVGVKKTFNGFLYETSYNYEQLYEIATNIINNIIKDPSHIDYTIFLQQSLPVSVLSIDNCTDVYYISNTLIKNDVEQEIPFRFKVEHAAEHCSELPPCDEISVEIGFCETPPITDFSKYDPTNIQNE